MRVRLRVRRVTLANVYKLAVEMHSRRRESRNEKHRIARPCDRTARIFSLKRPSIGNARCTAFFSTENRTDFEASLAESYPEFDFPRAGSRIRWVRRLEWRRVEVKYWRVCDFCFTWSYWYAFFCPRVLAFSLVRNEIVCACKKETIEWRERDEEANYNRTRYHANKKKIKKSRLNLSSMRWRFADGRSLICIRFSLRPNSNLVAFYNRRWRCVLSVTICAR